MVKVPFHREIEDLFASDKSIALKLLGGAFVGGLVSLRVALKDSAGGGPGLSTPMKVTIVVAAALIGMLVVLLLSFRDVVVRRVRARATCQSAPPRYFGRGNGCLMLALWFVTVIFATFIVTMVTVSL